MTTLVKPRKRGADPDKLTAGEQKFILEFLAAGMINSAEAVRRAYPSCKNPAQYATKLLKRCRVQAILGKVMRQDVEKLELDRHETLRQLYWMMSRNGADLFDSQGILISNHRVIDGVVQGTTIHDLPECIKQSINGVKQRVKRFQTEDGREIEVVETELKLVPKEKAVEMAMKHKGLFAPETLLVKGQVSIDWSSLFRKPDVIDVDPVEEEIGRALLPAPKPSNGNGRVE